MLFRKNEQTAREGTRHRRAVHSHGCGPQTGTADGYPPVPNEGAVSIARRADEHCMPSAWRRQQLPRRGRGKVGGRAHDRCLCVQWTRLSPQPSMPPQKHASVHDHHMLCMISPACIESRLAGVEMCSCWAQVVVGMGAKHLAAWFTSACDWLQLVSRRGRLGGARTGSPESTSFIACIHRGERGRLCGLPGGPGAHCRRSYRSGMVSTCPVVDDVAAGCLRARLMDVT